MSVTDQLLRHNEHYAGSFGKGHLPLTPAKGVAVVAVWTRGSTSTTSSGSTRATPT
jgi:hypothetical protein